MSIRRFAFSLVTTSLVFLFGIGAASAAPNTVSGSVTLMLGNMQQIPTTFSGTVSSGVATITSIGAPAELNGFVANGGFFTPTSSIPSGPKISAVEYLLNPLGGVGLTWVTSLASNPGIVLERKLCWNGAFPHAPCSSHTIIEVQTHPIELPPTTLTVATPGPTSSGMGVFTTQLGVAGLGTFTTTGTRGTSIMGTGFDNRTLNGVGTLQLVSPIAVTAPRFSTTTVGFTQLKLVYSTVSPVPSIGIAWGLPLLLGTFVSVGVLRLRLRHKRA